jgi:hypothetical protein
MNNQNQESNSICNSIKRNKVFRKTSAVVEYCLSLTVHVLKVGPQYSGVEMVVEPLRDGA